MHRYFLYSKDLSLFKEYFRANTLFIQGNTIINFKEFSSQYASIYTSSNIFKKFIQTFYKLKKNCIFLPKEGEYWKIKHGQNSLFAVIAKEMPLKVKYFEPSCKGSFQILNEKEYDMPHGPLKEITKHVYIIC